MEDSKLVYVHVEQFGTGDAILCEECSMSIDSCTVRQSARDGIVCLRNSTPCIRNTVVQRCKIGLVSSDTSAPVVERCTFSHNETGVQVNRMSKPWMGQTSVTETKGSGVVVQDFAEAVLVDCSISKSKTQGLLVAGGEDSRPRAAVLRGRVHEQYASGIKVKLNHALAQIHRVVFDHNADHDVDVADDGRIEASVCRFDGGCQRGVVVWDRGTGQFTRNSFSAYGLWALDVHPRGHVVLQRNVFHTPFDPSTVDVNASCGSGVQLQEKASGEASGNVFVGWQKGYVRSRVAFSVTDMRRVLWKTPSTINAEDLEAQPVEVMECIANIAHQTGTISLAPKQRHIATDAGKRVAPLSGPSSVAAVGCPVLQLGSARVDMLSAMIAVDSASAAFACSGLRMTETSWNRIGKAISSHPALESLQFIDVGLNDTSASHLLRAIAEAPNITSVDMQNNILSDATATEVQELLKHHPKLKRFSLHGNKKVSASALEDVEFLSTLRSDVTNAADQRALVSVRSNCRDCTVLSLDVGVTPQRNRKLRRLA